MGDCKLRQDTLLSIYLPFEKIYNGLNRKHLYIPEYGYILGKAIHKRMVSNFQNGSSPTILKTGINLHIALLRKSNVFSTQPQHPTKEINESNVSN